MHSPRWSSKVAVTVIGIATAGCASGPRPATGMDLLPSTLLAELPAPPEDPARDPLQLALDHAEAAPAGQPGAFALGVLLGPIGLALGWAVAGDDVPGPTDAQLEPVLRRHGEQVARDYLRTYQGRLRERRRSSAVGYALGGWATTTVALSIWYLNARANAEDRIVPVLRVAPDAP